MQGANATCQLHSGFRKVIIAAHQSPYTVGTAHQTRAGSHQGKAECCHNIMAMQAKPTRVVSNKCTLLKAKESPLQSMTYSSMSHACCPRPCQPVDHRSTTLQPNQDQVLAVCTCARRAVLPHCLPLRCAATLALSVSASASICCNSASVISSMRFCITASSYCSNCLT